MSIEAVLARVDKARKAGANSWRIQCPVHNGRDFNMKVTETDDRGVIAHCYVCGAGALELADELGIDRKEIFPPDNDYAARVITRKMESEEKQDRLIVMMDAVTPAVTLADKRRVQLAKARLEGIEAKRNAINEAKSVASDVIPF